MNMWMFRIGDTLVEWVRDRIASDNGFMQDALDRRMSGAVPVYPTVTSAPLPVDRFDPSICAAIAMDAAVEVFGFAPNIEWLTDAPPALPKDNRKDDNDIAY